MTQAERILITGAGGRLGRLLRAAQCRDGDAAQDVIFQSRQAGADITWGPGDALGALPSCDMLVALWGRTAGGADTLAQNAALVDLTCDVARACGARRVMHLSTAAVYGPGAALSESSPLRPANAYGRAKCEMEARIAARRAADGPGTRHVVLRLANVVGADSLAPALRAPGPVTLDRFADGDGPRRSYIGPGDVLRVLKQLAGLDPASCPEILNVAAPEPVEMAALARAAGQSIAWRDAPESAVQNVTLDATRLSGLLASGTLSSRPTALIRDWQELEPPR